MSTIRCEVVTAECTVFEGDVDMVIAPGIEGQLGILPQHAPLITTLSYGELVLRREREEDQSIAIGGGFMEVGPGHITILADSAERAEEIDMDRASAAQQRAEEDQPQPAAQHRKEIMELYPIFHGGCLLQFLPIN